jgi:hypothetical protein
MKKTLLLSMAASAVLFAGGDIAPVVVPEPAAKPCPTSNLKWYGQTVLYYQTVEQGNAIANFELFDGDVSSANAGLKLGVTGTNLMGTGLGFGAEVVALGTLGLEKDGEVATAAEVAAATAAGFAYSGGIVNDYVDNVMQLPSAGNLNGGALTQLYLTYTMGNTSLKVGRMELPKSLSPLAFSESWNVFKNTFEAAVVVNTDLPDTTLVGAYVMRANGIGNLGAWDDIGSNAGLDADNDGVFMLTAVNKSIEGLALTGTVYYGSEIAGVEDMTALWGDAKFMMPVAGHNIGFGVQGGTIDIGASEATIAYGAKAMGKFNLPAFGNVALCAAYTGVDLQNSMNGAVAAGVPVVNVATGVKTPLYTQMVLNQDYISGGMSANGTANTMMVKGTATYDLPALGNVSFTVAYSMTERENGAGAALNDYNELDVIAKTKLGGAEVLAAYVTTEVDDGVDAADDRDAVRIWAKWNF